MKRIEQWNGRLFCRSADGAVYIADPSGVVDSDTKVREINDPNVLRAHECSIAP